MGKLEREWDLIETYIREVKINIDRYRRFGPDDAIRWFVPWRRYMKAHGHCLDHEIPWLTFPSIDLLRDYLEPDMRVFEYGSGGSTLFFARRVREVVSMEHNGDWYAKLMGRIEEEKIQNCTVHLVPPSPLERHEGLDPADPDSYVSKWEEYEGLSFREYVTQIEQYPDCHFDVVVVDGRARPSCFKHALSKVKNDGLLIWDNTDRDHYQPAMKLAPDRFTFRRCPGPTPFVNHFTETSLWKGRKS